MISFQATLIHYLSISTPNPKSEENVLAFSHPSLEQTNTKRSCVVLGLRMRTASLSLQVCFLRFFFPFNQEDLNIEPISLPIAIFPGYYTGRATHIHAKVFTEWTPHPNGTYSGSHLLHVGQFFFDDDMNMVVDKVRFYTLTTACGRMRRRRIAHTMSVF